MQHAAKINPSEAFENGPVSKAVIKNAIPALIAMVMVMVYNLADVFFIGLTHDDLQVAAVSIGSPVFMIFMSLGTMFGVGGTSVISRALGAGKREYAKRVTSFCMWSCLVLGLCLMALLWIFMDDLCRLLGASENTMEHARTYLSITVGCGVFSMFASCFSSIIRSEGNPMKAMTGTLIGNMVNLILDPIMILSFGWGIKGAAIATVIGNVVGAGYYLFHFISGKSVLSIHPRDFSMKEGIAKGVLGIGISASLVNLLVSVTSIVANAQLSKYGDLYVAGYGVTSKVMMIITLVGIGIGSGVQPMVGYLYGAKKKLRLIAAIRFSTLLALCVCLVISVLCYCFTPAIVKVFLTDEQALRAGVNFTRILLSTGWLIGAFAIFQISLQAMGAAASALIASVARQGILLIPTMFLMQALIGMTGLLWAQPIADVLSLALVVWMLARKIRRTDFDSENSENTVS